MATNNTSSAQIAAAQVVPIVKTNPGNSIKGTQVMSAVGYVANATDDTSGSIQRFMRVPSNATVRSLRLWTGVATLAGAVNIGLYQTEENGGAVVDADLFATALALTGGPFVGAEVIDNAQLTVAEMVKPLWEVLGLTEDPQIDYDVATTISTTFNAAAVGQTMVLEYVV